MGGYVAGPPVMAAFVRRVPVVVMEPNAIPGFTNRVIARLVSRALVSFPETARLLSQRPHRGHRPAGPRGVLPHSAKAALATCFNILITGGSQGSRTLNHAARQSWPLFRADRAIPCASSHQTGTPAFEETRDAFARSGLEGEVVPFIADMPAAFAAADLIVCRAGAGAVSELAAAGKPSILVPFPFAADDHQTRNAEAMERAGAPRAGSRRRNDRREAVRRWPPSSPAN